VRKRLLLVCVFALNLSLCGALAAADDPAKNQDEPPVRLKKKIKPEQSAQPPEKKQQPPAVKGSTQYSVLRHLAAAYLMSLASAQST